MAVTESRQLHAQMNFQDSSVQVITFWDLGETFEYEVELQKIAFNGSDTSSNEIIKYNVEVSVIDSTEDAYVVRWFYKDFQSNAQNPIIRKLTNIAEDIGVEIKISGYGEILSVVNWEEVRDYTSTYLDSIRSEFPAIPELQGIIDKVAGFYATKASIEASSIQDAQQFHSFHGARYPLNERLTGIIKTNNAYYPENPFDTEVSVTLEEMDRENNQYLIRSFQEVNTEQLIEATYNYLQETIGHLGDGMPGRELFDEMSNTVETASIIHNSGWVLESMLWKEVVVQGETNMEIRRISLK